MRIEVGSYEFYMETSNQLPLKLIKENGEMEEIKLDNLVKDTDDNSDYEGTFRDLLEENGYTFDYDDTCIFNIDDLEVVDSIDTYYRGSDMVDSTTTFYKINEDLYAVNPANENTFYAWDDLEDMILENVSKLEVWHQGNEEVKKIVFGDDLEDVKEVVLDENNQENCFIIVDEIALEENKPAFSFQYVGITNENNLVYYNISNCNTTQADRPIGNTFTIEEMMENYKLEKEEKLNKDYPIFTPYKEIDVHNVLEFCKRRRSSQY